MKPNLQALRIDQAVRYWEDTAVLNGIIIRAAKGTSFQSKIPLTGPLVHAKEFRRELLWSIERPFDEDRFIGPTEPMLQVLRQWLTVPVLVYHWARKSRRIYHLTHEVQAFLNVTSVRKLRWSDVAWPFDAFAISLATPLQGHAATHDFLLIWTDKDEKTGWRTIRVMSLPRALGDYQPVGPATFKKIERCLQKNDWVRAEQLVRQLQERSAMVSPAVFVLNVKLADPIVKTINPDQEVGAVLRMWNGYEEDTISMREYPLIETAVRLIVGMCQYVTTRPAGISPTTEWEDAPTVPGGDPYVVTKGSQTCVVQTAFTFDPTELRTYEDVGTVPHARIEMSPHFRCGFWRRPPGLGQDPHAPKTIWVRPTIVRADRLAPGTLPRGSQAKVARG